MIATLIGHSLAKQMNWNGSNQKRPFQSLRLKRVVTVDENNTAAEWKPHTANKCLIHHLGEEKRAEEPGDLIKDF